MSQEADGSGAILGARVMRYSGVQGAALAGGAVVNLLTVVAVAHFLGPDDLGRFALLFFLANLLTQVFILMVKPGTIRRTFGAGDDEEDEDDSDEREVATSPKRSLGLGVVWGTVLSLAAAGIAIALREPIAELLLGDAGEARYVVLAGVAGGAGVLARLTAIALWFERRPGAFLVAEVSRPVLIFIATIVLLAGGSGVEGAIAAMAIGTTAAAVGGVVLLRGSFEPNLDPRELRQFLIRGAHRAPIAGSLWIVQNADIFLLSRFVDHTELGIYTLASRLAIVVAILPQGFRAAMRPLRKSAGYAAVRDQYGRKTERGQLLGYFTLLCITTVLAMVLAGELLVNVAPPAYADAAPLIPLTAAAFVMPPLYRTVNGQTAWPGKGRRHFVLATIGVAIAFVGLSLALMPEIGVYGAPVAMLVAFAIPCALFFARTQLSPNRIDFPYGEVARALAAAVVLAVGYQLLPIENEWLGIAVAAVFMFVYLVSLFALRAIPEKHWAGLSTMLGAVVSGRAERLNPRVGLRTIGASDRAHLRTAVLEGLSPDQLAAPAISAEPPAGAEPSEPELTEGARLVRVLRLVGREGGMPIRLRSRRDPMIGEFLFAAEPIAVRTATMRRLLGRGAAAADLRSLEDLVGHLKRIPEDAWSGAPAPRTRRRAASRRGRAAVARAARGFGRRL